MPTNSDDHMKGACELSVSLVLFPQLCNYLIPPREMLHFTVEFPFLLCFAWWIQKMWWTLSPRLCPHTRARGNPLRVFCCFSFIWVPCRPSPMVPALLAPHLCPQLKIQANLFWGGKSLISCYFPIKLCSFISFFLTPSLTCFAELSRGKAAKMIRLWRSAFQPHLPPNRFPVTWLQQRKVSFNSCIPNMSK